MRISNFNCAAFIALVAMLPAAPARAQDPFPLIDPATISLPSVTLPSDPVEREKVLGDGYKFFYFHKSGVSFDKAYADLRECRAHLTSASAILLPDFIPFGEESSKPVASTTSPYGLVGAAMAAIILPKLDRGLENNKLRRCMGTRGYARYALSEETWKTINTGEEDQVVAMQAKIAAGPRPDQSEVVR